MDINWADIKSIIEPRDGRRRADINWVERSIHQPESKQPRVSQPRKWNPK
jgi:hypothetical protein